MVPASAPGRPRAKGPKRAPAQAPEAQSRASKAPAGKGGDGLSDMERGIAEEINRLRRDPRAFARVLTTYRGYYDGPLLRLPGQSMAIRTFEGVAAVDEAIAVARKSKRRGPLALSAGLSRAARAHAREIGQAGTIAHQGRDGSSPFDRMQRHGRVLGRSGENIGTGHGDAATMVIDLFVDDGVANRGHRVNLMEPRYQVVGVGCAPHRDYGTVCVMGFAEGFEEQ